MTVRCTDCPLRKMKIFEPFTAQEAAFMERFKSGELAVEPGAQLLMEGTNSPQLFTVLSGQGVRYKTLEDGRRQVLNFVFPGDFLGMQAGIMGEMRHSVDATTEMRLCVFNRSELWSLFRTRPERSFDLTWIAAVEESFLGEALATVGQLSAGERIAWAMVRLFERARAVGLTDGNTMPLPYRQQDLADALGLSLVHTNKTLGRLRQRQLASWIDGKLIINHIDALAKMAGIELAPPETRPLI